MHESDKDILRDLLEDYHMSEILSALSDLAAAKASQLSDWELPDSAKRWSEISFALQGLSETAKL